MELIFPLNLDRLGHPLPLVGTTIALMGFGSLASRIPGGAWYRLSRARLLCVISLALMGLSTVGLGIGEVWGVQACLGAVHGFAFGLATTFLLALLIEVRPQDESAAPTMAWYTAAISLGYALGAPLAGQTIERFGYAGAFLISGLVGFAGAALSLAMRPMNEVAPTVGQARQPAAVLPSHGWRSLARLPAGIWLATMLVFYINFVSDANGAFFPIYAVGAGISVGTVGFLKSLHSVVGTCLRFAAVGLFRLVDAGLVNHLSVVAMALATIALSILTHEVALAVVFVVLGACRGLIRVTSATMVAEERKRPGVDVGMASGVYNAGLDAGTMLGPPVAGALAGIMDIPRMFRVVALVLPALYYVVWLAQRARASRPAIVGTRVAS